MAGVEPASASTTLVNLHVQYLSIGFNRNRPDRQGDIGDSLDLTRCPETLQHAVLCACASVAATNHRHSVAGDSQPLGCESVGFVVCDYFNARLIYER